LKQAPLLSMIARKFPCCVDELEDDDDDADEVEDDDAGTDGVSSTDNSCSRSIRASPFVQGIRHI